MTVRPVIGVTAFITGLLIDHRDVRRISISINVCALTFIAILASALAKAQRPPPVVAIQSPIHQAATATALAGWLARVPTTRQFPPDFDATLRGQAPAFVAEMSTDPQCLPCADLWAKLGNFRARYGWRVAVIDRQEALLRSGRLGLPWVGNPVLWVRPISDPSRIVPVAIGTDQPANIARNIYLGVKMLTGVRADVGVRAMAKFTGIVGLPSAIIEPAR